MATIVKMQDLSWRVAVKLFVNLNEDHVWLKYSSQVGYILISSKQPKQLIYPEGWRYADGFLKKDVETIDSPLIQIPIVKNSGEIWREETEVKIGDF